MFETVLDNYQKMTLDDISSVSLMNRMDTKYVMHRQKTAELLERLSKTHAVVSIDSQLMLPYRTLYFDTPDFACYHSHHSGKLNRFKYRTREYISSGISFCEVKHKSNKGKTRKNRIRRIQFCEEMDGEFTDLALEQNDGFDGEFIPQLMVTYTRTTLVDRQLTERLTIDTDLTFVDYSNLDNRYGFSDLVIVENKQERGSRDSHSTTHLRNLRCKPSGFSKYCIGVALLKESVKKNLFKQKIRAAMKIENA